MSKLNNTNDCILPYEKCIRYGAESLSDAELLAVIIRNGTRDKNCLELAQEVLKLSGNMGILGLKHFSHNDFKSIKGIGDVKSIMFQCISELSNRIAKATLHNRIKFQTSKEAAHYCMEDLRHLERECFLLLLLNTKCELIHEKIISMGTINSTSITPREIFKYALAHNAVYLILVHNHPSGDPTPSNEDIVSTEKIIEVGRVIGIPVIDHIIIGDNKYISLKEQNLI